MFVQFTFPTNRQLKGGHFSQKAANLSSFGSYAAQKYHKGPKMYARTPCATRGVVLCRKSTKSCPLDIKFLISELMSHSKYSSAALEILSVFGQF